MAQREQERDVGGVLRLPRVGGYRLDAELSGGRVGYIYVQSTGVDAQNELVQQFMGQWKKDGLIIDERWNGGGQIPDRFIELLNRPILAYWAVRDGTSWQWPPVAHRGPQVMLINGWSGSGGDAFPTYFKQAGIGPLIGTRTWGGLIGISGAPTLVDGGNVTVPTFRMYDAKGTWFAEGHGVDPDIPVDENPTELAKGTDPQIERAIQEVLARIKERPDAQLLQTVMLRSLQQAVYSPDNVGHFGLAYESYTHFTSPIRRYPDLLVHRALVRGLGLGRRILGELERRAREIRSDFRVGGLYVPATVGTLGELTIRAAHVDPDLAVGILGRVEELKRTESGLCPDPFVTGDDLIGMGFSPGPGFKGTLERVYDGQLEDRVKTRDEALELARRLGV